MEITPRFKRGPDFTGPGGKWWDITTEEQWAAHQRRYGPGGTRIGY